MGKEGYGVGLEVSARVIIMLSRNRYVICTRGGVTVTYRNPLHDACPLLREELELYCEGLSNRPSLIIANKIDISTAAVHLPRLEAAALELEADGDSRALLRLKPCIEPSKTPRLHR